MRWESPFLKPPPPHPTHTHPTHTHPLIQHDPNYNTEFLAVSLWLDWFLNVSCSDAGVFICKRLRWSCEGVGGPCCSYPTGVEKGISEPWLSLLNPRYYPTTNYHSRGWDEKEGRREGAEAEAVALQYAFYKVYSSWLGFGWVWW